MRHTARHITRCQTPPGRLGGACTLAITKAQAVSTGSGAGALGRQRPHVALQGCTPPGCPRTAAAGPLSPPSVQPFFSSSPGSEARSVFFLSPAWNRGTDLVCEGRQVCARHEKVAAAGSNAENPRDSARHVSGSAPYHCARRARARSDDGSPCQDVAPCLPRLGRASSWFVQARAGSCLAAG